MEENKELSKYGHITKEKLEEVLNEIHNKKVVKDRDLKLTVFFNNQYKADNWMKMFNNLLMEEFKEKYNE